MSDLYIGIMTGTSLDGADMALVDFSRERNQIENLGRDAILGFKTYDYPQSLHAEILSVNQNQATTISRIGDIDSQLGEFFAQATLQFLSELAIRPQAVCAIGCHGQTMWHQPEGLHRYSMQLGNASVLANRSQIDVVADFRNADIAFGGQGAPLAPAYHHYIFGDTGERRMVVNIGGIANITCLIPNKEIIGYDTGPGNILMDAWAAKHLQQPFDKDGCWAMSAQGPSQNQGGGFLAHLLRDEWLAKPGPKSTGREYFNLAWLEAKIESYGTNIAPVEVQAALADFTAKSISDQMQPFSPDVAIICGGGANNPYLMERLKTYSYFCDVQSCNHYGVAADAVEAAMFAWFAHRHCQGLSGSIPTVTGATQPAILGALYPHTPAS